MGFATLYPSYTSVALWQAQADASFQKEGLKRDTVVFLQ